MATVITVQIINFCGCDILRALTGGNYFVFYYEKQYSYMRKILSFKKTIGVFFKINRY